MDEIWERAVETALDGLTDHASARTLTLDGAVKCVHGRLPRPSLFEKFENLQLLSIANVGVSSLEQFPRLRNLQKLNLSDNRIAGGLESLVQSGLDALRDLDLSNNRIQFIEDLAPLAQLMLVSLDLYECPVTRVKDYRSRVFGLIKSLKYLDKMDAEENERPESDDEEEDEDDEEEEDDDDPGSGEVDGEERLNGRIMSNGRSEGVVDMDEDEESDADVEEVEAGPGVVHGGPRQNGFKEDEGEDDDDEGEDDYNESGEEIDEEDGDEDDVVEVHEVEDDSSDEDGDEDDEREDDGEEDEEEVDNIEGGNAELASNGRMPSIEGEIDGHEHGEDEGDDDNGETGEEEQVVEDDGEFEDEDEDEDSDAGYLVQPVGQAEVHDVDGSDMEQGDEEDEPEVDEEVEDDEVQVLPSSSQLKRKRDDKKSHENGDAVDDDDPDCSDSPAKKKHQ